MLQLRSYIKWFLYRFYLTSTGQLLTETTSYGLTTTYNYDVWLRKRKVTDYLGKSESYLFEKYSNSVKVTTFNDDGGQDFVLFYDLGRESIKAFKNINEVI